MDDAPTYQTGHCRVTYLPTVLLGRPVLVRKPKGKRKPRAKSVGRRPVR